MIRYAKCHLMNYRINYHFPRNYPKKWVTENTYYTIPVTKIPQYPFATPF